MDLAFISALGAALSGLAAIIGLLVAYLVYKGQSELASKIHTEQKLLSQRQLLIPLWGYMASLNDIDPANIIEPDVLKIVNTLELVALCCEGGMVDKAVIKRTFKDVYMKLYEQVSLLPKLSGVQRSGTELINQNPAAKKFYKELEDDHMQAGQLAR